MKKTILIITLAIIFCFTALTEAALVDRGGGLIYCDTLDITWLQNANYAGTMMTWDEAVPWADNLEYEDSVRGVTWDDWRLPTTVDGALVYGYEGDPDGDGEYNYTWGYNLANSEMGHLYYNELGNKGYIAPDGTENPPEWGLKNTGDFINLQQDNYWSSTDYATEPANSWYFNFNAGGQNVTYKDHSSAYAWAVRDGDVVPIPSSCLLLLSGVIGLVGIKKKVC